MLLENVPSWAKTGHFPAKSLRLRHTERVLRFLFGIPQPQCRTTIVPRDFSKFLHEAELHCYPYGAAASRTSKRGERLRKKGGQYLLPPKNAYYIFIQNLMEISLLRSDMT